MLIQDSKDTESASFQSKMSVNRNELARVNKDIFASHNREQKYFRSRYQAISHGETVSNGATEYQRIKEEQRELFIRKRMLLAILGYRTSDSMMEIDYDED